MIAIKKAQKSDLYWINSMYKEVDFVASNFDNEYIVIALVNNQNAGLGRLVYIDNQNIELGGIYVFENFRGLKIADLIVSTLLKENPFQNTTIWCLPFENLLAFYQKFDFKENSENNPPEKVLHKLNWCTHTYNKKTLLLSKKS